MRAKERQKDASHFLLMDDNGDDGTGGGGGGGGGSPDKISTPFGAPEVIATPGANGRTRIVVELGEVPEAFRHLIKQAN